MATSSAVTPQPIAHSQTSTHDAALPWQHTHTHMPLVQLDRHFLWHFCSLGICVCEGMWYAMSYVRHSFIRVNAILLCKYMCILCKSLFSSRCVCVMCVCSCCSYRTIIADILSPAIMLWLHFEFIEHTEENGKIISPKKYICLYRFIAVAVAMCVCRGRR